MKKQKNILPLLATLVVGFCLGVGFTVWKMDKLPASAVSQREPTQNKQEEQITILQNRLATDPNDGLGWAHLGNLYYDTNQPQKAIDAYLHSLKIQPGTPDLLTDLGVMYRRTGQPKKALQYFDKAAEDQGHLPSRYNKGVVLFRDMNKPSEAIKAWEEIVKINPEAATATGEKITDIIIRSKERITRLKKRQ